MTIPPRGLHVSTLRVKDRGQVALVARMKQETGSRFPRKCEQAVCQTSRDGIENSCVGIFAVQTLSYFWGFGLECDLIKLVVVHCLLFHADFVLHQQIDQAAYEHRLVDVAHGHSILDEIDKL